jgi:aminoglycoside/choline kinase family phosphotransferase
VKPYIPEHLDELTPDWFTGVLRERGLLDDESVTGVSRQMLGDGEGFLGVIARMTLEYDRDPTRAPRTLIAKLPQAVNRAMGEMLGAYERESLFYEELASNVPLRTPELYYSAFDRDRGSEQQAKIMAFVDRIPVSLAQRTLGVGKWIAGRKKRRYILLMEDLAPARVGDQVAGGSPEDCARLLRAVAPAHAAFWGGDALQEQFWVVSQSIDLRMRYGMFREARWRFAERYPALMNAGLDRVIDWLSVHGLELSRKLCLGPPETMLHCDLRLDNVFFDDTVGNSESSDTGVIIFDWQLVRRGPAAYDVAYFLSGALAPETDAETERSLLQAYHEALLAGGVTDYAFSALELDYRRGLLAVLQTMTTIGDVDMGDGRGVDLANLWIERLAGRVCGLDLDALL